MKGPLRTGKARLVQTGLLLLAACAAVPRQDRPGPEAGWEPAA